MPGAALVVALALLAVALPGAASAADPLAIKGGRIVDARGRQVVLHGANAVFKRPPYFPPLTRADFARMRSWGFDAIRLGVIWAGLEPQRGVIDQTHVSRHAYPHGACTSGRGFVPRPDRANGLLRLRAEHGASRVALRAFRCLGP